MVGIVAVLNLLSYKFPWRWDLTAEKEFTLSPSTTQVLDGLKDRLTVKLYYSENLPPQLSQIEETVSDILEELKAHAVKPMVIEKADPDSNEMKEQETLMLGIQPLQVNIIEKDKRELKKVYMGMAFYYQDRKEVIPVVAQVENFEYAAALSILKLTEKEMPRIGLILPESASSDKYRILPEALKQIGLPVRLNFTDKKLADRKLKALVLVEPREVPEDFVKEMDELVKGGADILLFAGRVEISDNLSPGSITTGLDDWLAGKGVTISEKLLLDPRQNGQAAFQTGFMQLYVPYPFWVKSFSRDMDGEHPITSQLEEVLMPWTNVVEIKSTEDGEWKTKPLVSSSQASFLQEDGMPSVSPQYMEEMTQSPAFATHPLSVALTNAKDEKSGRVFLTSNFNIVQDQFLQQSPANAVFLQNMLEYSSRGQSLIGIRSRGMTSRPLKDLTDSARSAIKWAHMVGVPILSILIGMGILLVAKKRRERLIIELLQA